MTTSMPVDDWVSVLRREYLEDFIKSGGVAIRFVIPQDDLSHRNVLKGVRQAAEENGYLFASVDAAKTKVHMIERVFHDVARQVDWDGLAYAFLRSTLQESHYRVPDSRGDFRLAKVADLNGLDISEARSIANNLLRKRLFQDYSLTQEFRVAMTWLCRTQLDPEDAPDDMRTNIVQWLTGELRLISALRSALIFQRIGRDSGRHMLFSLSHWLHLAGKTGLVMTLDISRFLEAKRPKEPNETIYYSTAAVLDGYEVLRQFVDDTDEWHWALVIVLAPPALVEMDRRGLTHYDALRLRIWDDVRDRQRPNPLSSLVRLHGQDTGANSQPPGGAS
ncbi:MAG: DUF2791 family P-loop domain-containing protein [Chloroflexi bacterium]|nr:DUF2791 family P-loop domain-containing protein [Chloroflexota bacterium]